MTKNNKIFVTILITTLALLSFFVILYVIGSNSEPFKVATNRIEENKIVESNLGKLTSTRLAFLGYSVRYNGPHGWAEFEVCVRGNKDKGTVFVTLEKKLGDWEVVAARLKLDKGGFINIVESGLNP